MRTRGKPITTTKSTAEQRTAPLPGIGTSLTCSMCELTFDPAKATRRDDGTPECPDCGNPVEEDARPVQDAPGPKVAPAPEPAAKRDPGPTSTERAAVPPTQPRKEDLELAEIAGRGRKEKASDYPRAFCDQCGAEWFRIESNKFRPVPNCGHTEGFVDHPSKAKAYRPPAGHGVHPDMVRPPPKLQLVKAEDPISGGGEAPAPVIRTANGPRLVVEWGKANFPVASYSNFTVGPFMTTTELAEGDNPVDVAARMMAQLQEIAERSFETQRKWYARALGILKDE